MEKAYKTKAVWDASECALVLIDYQPEMFNQIRSSDPLAIEHNICAIAKAALAFKIPVVLSTVGVEMGVNRPTIDPLQKILMDVRAIDRSNMNAWEDAAFLKAIHQTGKKRLIFGALYTEICLTYPVVEALTDDFDVSFVADAVGGESKVEHDTAIARLLQAGATPHTTVAIIAEWFRDWKSPHAVAGREIIRSLLAERRKLDSIMPAYPQNDQQPPAHATH